MKAKIIMESVPKEPAVHLLFWKNDKEDDTSLGQTLEILSKVIIQSIPRSFVSKKI